MKTNTRYLFYRLRIEKLKRRVWVLRIIYRLLVLISILVVWLIQMTT